MEIKESVWKKRGKAVPPEATVEKIIDLLKKAGIETDYTLFPPTLEGCYSSRVTLKAPFPESIGANGKGVTPELCKASAYAELMERLQNAIFMERILTCDPESEACTFMNGRPVYDLFKEAQPEAIRALFDKIIASAGTLPPLVSPERLVKELFRRLSNRGKGLFPTRKFYAVKKKCFVDLPYEIPVNFCLSNGMASGNTLAEAIVQASSEIFERFAEYRILDGDITPPPVPRNVIESFPSVIRIIHEIEADPRYEVRVLDCSLGLKLPVVCGVVIDKKNQTFGIKFGAYPDMEVAMERVFSEAMQGSNLESFVRLNVPAFDNDDLARVNRWNLVKVGIGCFPASILKTKADYRYVPWPEVKDIPADTLAEKCIEMLEALGADTYIADVSYLGFPAVFVYAAGISEGLKTDLLTLKELALANEVYALFREDRVLTKEETAKVLNLVKLKRFAKLENGFSVMSGLYENGQAKGFPMEADFLTAVLYCDLQDYEAASKVLSGIRSAFDEKCDPDAVFFRAFRMMTEALSKGRSMAEAKDILFALCPEDVASEVFEAFESGRSLLRTFYPSCPEFDCTHCEKAAGCTYLKIRKLYFLLRKYEAEHPTDEDELRRLFC